MHTLEKQGTSWKKSAVKVHKGFRDLGGGFDALRPSVFLVAGQDSDGQKTPIDMDEISISISTSECGVRPHCSPDPEKHTMNPFATKREANKGIKFEIPVSRGASLILISFEVDRGRARRRRRCALRAERSGFQFQFSSAHQRNPNSPT
jgi:hypothetical protein